MRFGGLSRNRPKGITHVEDGAGAPGLHSIALAAIEPSPYQPRREFSEDAIAELATSIAEQGLLHPIVVRPRGEKYELVVGERRLRACRALGWSEIPAYVREMDDKAAAEAALIENLQRESLSFFEEAEGYRRLIEEFGLTQDELARRLGKRQSTIANKLRLLKFEPDVREKISREIISERQARALLGLESAQEQIAAIEEIQRRGLNAAQTEALVKRWRERKANREAARPRMKALYKDIRLFMNSLQSLVKELERSGIAVEVERHEAEDAVEVRIRVPHGPKDRAGRGKDGQAGGRR
ncbi:MAG TPA: ParB/RepB/Spo0J family partition protein [Limnochordia bacterium]